jgi:dynein heavy chain
MEAQLENNKNELIKNKSDNEELMKKLDDDILRILATTKTNLIDDADIIGHLQQSKETEEKVRHQIESSATQMKKIIAARENYRKLAKTASKLFFIINDFSLIEPMYQFALDAYISLFEKIIKEYIEKPGLNDSLQ